jgi:hypothetical protein
VRRFHTGNRRAEKMGNGTCDTFIGFIEKPFFITKKLLEESFNVRNLQ